MPRVTANLAALFLLLGCAQFPRVDAFPATTTAPPELVPLDQLLAQADFSATSHAADHDARAARLRARAALMRGKVIDPATRARLAEAISAGES